MKADISNGWLGVPRELLNDVLWHNPSTFRLYFWVLMNANFVEHTYSGVNLEPGQYLSTYSALQEDLAYKSGRGIKNLSLKAIEEDLEALIRHGKINIEETTSGIIFTVLNYGELLTETTSGWVKMPREVVKDIVWYNPLAFRLYIWILMNATYREYAYLGIKLKPGQYIRSYSKLAEDLSYKKGDETKLLSKGVIANNIEKLLHYKKLTVESSEFGTLFTVVDYTELYIIGSSQRPIMQEIEQRKKNREHLQNDEDINDELASNNGKTNQDPVGDDGLTNRGLQQEVKNANNIKEGEEGEEGEIELFTHAAAKRLALELQSSIGAKIHDSTLEKWRKICYQMINVEQRDIQELYKVMEWSRQHNYWQNIVTNMSVFQKKYDEMLLEYTNQKKVATIHQKNTERKDTFIDMVFDNFNANH